MRFTDCMSDCPKNRRATSRSSLILMLLFLYWFTTRKSFFFLSLNPFQSFRKRGAKSIIFWIYVLHLRVHGRRLLCQLCGQCVIRLQVEHLTGHTSVPVNIAVLSLIIGIHSNIAGTEMQWNASTNLHSWRQMSRGWYESLQIIMKMCFCLLAAKDWIKCIRFKSAAEY